MRANRALVAASFLAAIATVVPRAAQAEPRSYRGTHPVDLDGHGHFDDSVHVHDDLPVGLGPFADFDGVLVFLADPEAFPGEVTSYAYDGTHPLPARFGTAYCGRDGVHSHPFIPEGDYRNEDGVYHFSGALHGGAPTLRPGRGSPPSRVERRTVPVVPAGGFPYGYVPAGTPTCTTIVERTRSGTTVYRSGYCPPPRRPRPRSVRPSPPHERPGPPRTQYRTPAPRRSAAPRPPSRRRAPTPPRAPD